MKSIYLNFIVAGLFSILILSGCLKSGYEEVANSSEKNLSAVTYTYRFLYNDTIQKGTEKQEILKDRVCEVVFNKVSTPINENGLAGISSSLTHTESSVLKAGPSGSVTRKQLYERFKTLISTDQLSKLWVFVTVSDVAKVSPIEGAPELGKPGDFSTDRRYRVTAADGSTSDYILRTVKGF